MGLNTRKCMDLKGLLSTLEGTAPRSGAGAVARRQGLARARHTMELGGAQSEFTSAHSAGGGAAPQGAKRRSGGGFTPPQRSGGSRGGGAAPPCSMLRS